MVFKGSYLKQKTTTFNPSNIINDKKNITIIVYKLDAWLRDLSSDFTLKDCFFGEVKVAKNADPGTCVYSGHGIVFYLLFTSESSLPDGSVGKMPLFLELI